MTESSNPPRDTTAAAAAPPPPPPVVPDHELIRVIGGGSGGQVWLARNVLGMCRAVKVVHARAFKRRRSFEREFEGVLRFEPVSRWHDGLMDILQVGCNDQDDYFYYVMEASDDVNTGQVVVSDQYVPRTLAYDFRQRRRLPIGECIRLGAAIASGLGYLHRNGLIHRDVKPSNIIFVNGFPKLADAGLVSELYEPGSRVGTEGFIAPEGAGTAQADIYSLGKVLYEISTGKDRNEYPELPPLKDNADDRDLVQFNKIVLNACRTNPHERYKTADELMMALLSFQFSHYDPERQRAQDQLMRVIGVVAPYIGFAVIVGMLWRLIWLLKHPPQ
ncbi:MAG TPA: serine/threonine-protein kinase [Candidatus Acidoferrum sp.]|nr:serine/threonine-protein kinase [Candidatus Acidoferrum sp.]